MEGLGGPAASAGPEFPPVGHEWRLYGLEMDKRASFLFPAGAVLGSWLMPRLYPDLLFGETLAIPLPSTLPPNCGDTY